MHWGIIQSNTFIILIVFLTVCEGKTFIMFYVFNNCIPLFSDGLFFLLLFLHLVYSNRVAELEVVGQRGPFVYGVKLYIYYLSLFNKNTFQKKTVLLINEPFSVLQAWENITHVWKQMTCNRFTIYSRVAAAWHTEVRL